MADEASTEADRVRAAYARRAELGLDARYEYWQPANLFIYQSRERALLSLLRNVGFLPLNDRQVLDVGCGSGAVLQDMVRYGAHPSDLSGIDLIASRVIEAQNRLETALIDLGDAQKLPYRDASFDLVLGFTLLSSVLDGAARQRIAGEMARVTKPGGLVVIYDFWTNPLNRDARPLRREDVRQLFPGRPVVFRGVTLAPPLVRLLVKAPGGWLACSLLEMIPFLRTHFLAAVRF
jgi:SAM-dependent methyltransferase